MSWREDLFTDHPASRRKLSLWLYALVAPALALSAYALAPQFRTGVLAFGGIAALSLLAVLWLALRKRPTWADWIFPMGIVPITCFAIAQMASGYSAVGPIIVAGATVAIAASLYELPTVLASMATAMSFSVLATMRQNSLVVACGDAGIVLVVQSVAIWMGRAKARYLRKLQTESAAALLRLKASEENFRTLVETIDDMVIVTTLDGRITYVNHATNSKLGYDDGELIGRSLRQLHPEELRARTDEHFQDTLLHKTHVCHLPFASKGGAFVQTEVRAWLGKWNGSDCVFSASKDMTAEKDAEQRFETVFRSSPAIMAITAAESERIMDVNHTTLAKLGYTRDELMGKTAYELGLFARPHVAREMTERLKREHHLEVPDASIRCKDGTLLSCSYSGEAITSHGQDYFLSVLVDVTAHKAAQKALEDLNYELSLATERANSLANKAEAASRAKSDFLANMSHEIRTPMNGVIGMTELLLQSGLTQQQLRYAEAIFTSGQTLMALVNQILDLSKIEAGKLVLDVREFNLQDLLDELVDSMGVKAGSKGLELIHDVAPAVPVHVRGDASRLRQILLNLLGNAVKFTEKGEVVLTVERQADPGTDVVLRFAIRDSGIGIAEETLGGLFQKFTQVDSSRTRKFGGTGLGLAISKQLTEMMRGQIGVRSWPGVGSDFWFTVRLEPARVDDGTRDDQPTRAPSPLSGMHVLVVDDHATGRSVLTKRLEAWGASVQSAADGTSALDLLSSLGTNVRFDVLLVDHDGRRMDGEAFARQLASVGLEAMPRLVLMPTSGQPLQEDRFRAMGYCCFLYKPVRYRELLQGLSTLHVGTTGWPQRGPSGSLEPIHLETPPGQRRVLLAEDNAINRQVTLAILARLGVEAVAVNDGNQAIRALREQPYDLVLMDVQMPEMDGIQAAHQIRRFAPADPNAGIPIVALTAHALESDRELCQQAGMNDYLTKPIAASVLAATLEKWLGWRARSALEARPRQEADVPPVAEPNPAGREVFDLAGLMDAVAGDDALARSLAETFPENAENLLATLAQFLAAGDALNATRQAHTLKGAAATMWGKALAEEASRCEQACRRSDLAEANIASSTMRDALTRLEAALRAFLGHERAELPTALREA